MIIPAAYIRHDLLPIYHEVEMQQSLGIPLDLCGVKLPPPFPAYFTLLDLADNKFFADPLKSELKDFAAAVALLVRPRGTAFRAAMKAAQGDREELDELSAGIYRDGMSEGENFFRLLTWIRDVPASGFALIPDKGDRARLPSPYLYDARWLAFIVRAYCSITGEPSARVLWKTPVCRIGHVIASEAEANGIKIRRPEDRESIKRQIAEAEDREKRGELHPWQIEHPHNPLYAPSPEQIAARFEIISDFENLKRGE